MRSRMGSMKLKPTFRGGLGFSGQLLSIRSNQRSYPCDHVHKVNGIRVASYDINPIN
jgi:hypothetical protein